MWIKVNACMKGKKFLSADPLHPVPFNKMVYWKDSKGNVEKCRLKRGEADHFMAPTKLVKEKYLDSFWVR